VEQVNSILKIMIKKIVLTAIVVVALLFFQGLGFGEI
jgi:hypothetical protein